MNKFYFTLKYILTAMLQQQSHQSSEFGKHTHASYLLNTETDCCNCGTDIKKLIYKYNSIIHLPRGTLATLNCFHIIIVTCSNNIVYCLYLHSHGFLLHCTRHSQVKVHRPQYLRLLSCPNPNRL